MHLILQFALPENSTAFILWIRKQSLTDFKLRPHCCHWQEGGKGCWFSELVRLYVFIFFNILPLFCYHFFFFWSIFTFVCRFPSHCLEKQCTVKKARVFEPADWDVNVGLATYCVISVKPLNSSEAQAHHFWNRNKRTYIEDFITKE